MSTEPSLDHLVEQAREGNQEALEAVVRALQDRIYNLALRMLWHPSDAEDATQEILLKVTTRLSQFRQESAFMTWVYQIATLRQKIRIDGVSSFLLKSRHVSPIIIFELKDTILMYLYLLSSPATAS